MSALFLSFLAAVLMACAFGSAALAATTAGQAHGLPGVAHLPTFLLSDKHPMAFAMLAMVLSLFVGRGYYLYRVLSQRERQDGIRA